MNHTTAGGLVDLADARTFLVAGPARKLWLNVLLLALRDRAEAIHLIVEGRSIRLTYRIDGKEYDLSPPPLDVADGLMEAVRSRLEIDPDTHRDASWMSWLVRKLVRRAGPAGEVSPPWSSYFRLLLGDGVADVAATASESEGGRVLTLTLSNASIPPDAAAERLGVLMAEHRARKASTGGHPARSRASG